MVVGEIRRQRYCEIYVKDIFITVFQYAACYVIKAWIFHQADCPWGNVPIYIWVIRM